MLKDWKIASTGFSYSVLRVLIFSILLVGSIFFFKSAIQYLFFPYDITHLESYVVYILQRFIEGWPLEGNYCSFPLITNTYPPVFYLFSAFLAGLLHLKSYFSLLVLTRLITLFSTLASALIILGISRKLKYNSFTSIIASLLFLGNPLLFGWGFCGRIDMMGITWSLSAIYALLFDKSRMSIYLALFFSLLAFYTKQFYISAVITIAVYFILTGKPRVAVRFSLYFAALVVFIFICLNYLSGGAAYINLVLFPAFPFTSSWLIKVLSLVWWKLLPLFILLAIAIGRPRKKLTVVNIYVFTTIFIAVVASAKRGADQNYWIEALAAIAIIAAETIDKLCDGKKKFIVYLVLPFLIFTYLRFSLAWLRGRLATDIEGHRQTKDLLVEMFKKAKGEVLYDGAPDVLINAGRPVMICDWPSYEATIQKGICSNSLTEPLIEKKSLDYIVFAAFDNKGIPDFVPPKIKELILANYLLIQKKPDALIYIPKGNTE